jgi:hypothetical protein
VVFEVIIHVIQEEADEGVADDRAGPRQGVVRPGEHVLGQAPNIDEEDRKKGWKGIGVAGHVEAAGPGQAEGGAAVGQADQQVFGRHGAARPAPAAQPQGGDRDVGDVEQAAGQQPEEDRDRAGPAAGARSAISSGSPLAPRVPVVGAEHRGPQQLAAGGVTEQGFGVHGDPPPGDSAGPGGGDGGGVVAPRWRPTAARHPRARSSWGRSWAAVTLVRSRAAPRATAG